METVDRIVEEKKNKILENINYAKESGMNKLSAILVDRNIEDGLVKKELISYFVAEGYKVSLYKDEVEFLVIEW